MKKLLKSFVLGMVVLCTILVVKADKAFAGESEEQMVKEYLCQMYG